MTTSAALPVLAETDCCPACRRPVARVVTQRGSVTFVDLKPRRDGPMVPVSDDRFAYRLPGERLGDGYGLHHRGGNCHPLAPHEKE